MPPSDTSCGVTSSRATSSRVAESHLRGGGQLMAANEVMKPTTEDRGWVGPGGAGGGDEGRSVWGRAARALGGVPPVGDHAPGEERPTEGGGGRERGARRKPHRRWDQQQHRDARGEASRADPAGGIRARA